MTIPASVARIYNAAFMGCTGLTSVSFQEGVTVIGNSAFYDCSNLKEILIPRGVESINDLVFGNCTALTTVYHKGSAEEWKQIKISRDNIYLMNANIIHDFEGDVIPGTCNHQWQKATCTAPKTCTACGATEGSVGEHSYNSGVITKPATCKEEGIKTYTCTGCSATKTEDIDKSTTHTYDNACDAICNVCAQERTVSHDYQTAWSKDKTGHWHECSVCKDKTDVAAHTPGAEATETTAQTCTTCGYVIQAALNHTHDYADTWTIDESGHWHTCSGCEEQGDYAAHAPGTAATETTAQTCAVCGYEIAPALGVPETQPSAPATEPETQPATQPESKPVVDSEPSADPTLWIVIVAVALLGIGIAAVIIWKKKR